MTYYFVDYENVHSDGIMDCTNLEKGDVVCVIYTEQAKNITLDVIEKLSRSGVTLELDKAGTGAKNALDFQLSSYLGYMIAKHEHEEVRYVIISKDTGFDRLVDFWGERGITVTRAPGLSDKEKPAKKSRKTAGKKTAQKKAKDRQKDAEKQQTPDGEREWQSAAENLKEAEMDPAETPKENLQETVQKQEETEHGAAENPGRNESGTEKKKRGRRRGTEKNLPETGQNRTENPQGTEQDVSEAQQEDAAQQGRHRLKEELLPASREELLQYLAQDEYADEILQIVNSFKTKQAINNGLSKLYRDNKKSSEIYKKLKPLMKEKKKS